MTAALLLLLVNATNYLLLVLNFRAVAQGSIGRTAATDAVLAAFSFGIIRHVAAAEGLLQWGGYVVGGVLGSVLALVISRRLERKAAA